jgi:hypothetical protein
MIEDRKLFLSTFKKIFIIYFNETGFPERLRDATDKQIPMDQNQNNQIIKTRNGFVKQMKLATFSM